MVSHLVWQCRFSSFTLSLLWCYCVALSYVCGVVLFVYDTWRNAEHIAVLLVLYIKLLTHQTFPVTVHISLACVPCLELIQDPLHCLRAAFVWNITNTVTYFVVTATLEQPNVAKFFFLLLTLQLSQVVTAGRIIFTNHLLIATDQNKKKRKRCRFSPLWNWCSGCYVQPIRGTDYRGLVFTDTEQQSAPAAAAQLTWAKASCFQPLTKIHKCSKQFRDNQLNQWHQYGLKTAQVRSLNCLTNKSLRTFGSTPTWPSSLSNLVTWLPSLLLS